MRVYRYVRFGYFVDCGDLFDAAAFRLAASEASAMDPQTRICLEQTQAGAKSNARQPYPDIPFADVTLQGCTTPSLRSQTDDTTHICCPQS